MCKCLLLTDVAVKTTTSAGGHYHRSCVHWFRFRCGSCIPMREQESSALNICFGYNLLRELAYLYWFHLLCFISNYHKRNLAIHFFLNVRHKGIDVSGYQLNKLNNI